MVKSTRIRTSLSEEIPVELIHHIQSLLPIKQATRTCLLSKAWLHALSSIPTLRFPLQSVLNETNYNNLIEGTLLRYHHDNIPIETFDLEFHIRNHESACLAKNWIRLVASKTCLKELSLCIGVDGIDSFTIPDEIFIHENLNTISVKGDLFKMTNSLWICSNFVVIKCVSLRVLELEDVFMSDEILNNLLSTCILLERIKLSTCEGLNTVKVRNLPCLRELDILSIEENDLLEIDNVPRLCLLRYNSLYDKLPPFSLSALGSVRQLHIGGVIMDNTFLDMIKSMFPFLESLTLVIYSWGLESLVILSVSLKNLTLELYINMPIDVQVYAPSLLSFSYKGFPIPSLLFPTTTPQQINLEGYLKNPVDHSLILKMREIRNLSSKFYMDIIDHKHDPLVPFNIDVDDINKRVSFPATNLQQLSLLTCSDEQRFFYAFLSICCPSFVKAQQCTFNYSRCFSNLMVRVMMEKNTPVLNEVQSIDPR